MSSRSNGALDFDPFAGPALERSAPSTESQREVWLASQIGSDASCAFNESVTLELRGSLDVPALRQALEDVLRAHEALRGVYADDGRIFVVTEPVCRLEELDWSGSTAAQQESDWRELASREVGTPFDLSAGPLVRFVLVKRGEGWHRLVMTSHHSVCDGWSQAIVLEDLGSAYSARLAGESGPGARPGFCDYARREWQAASGPEHADSLRFWTERFRGELPVLELPTDRPRGRRRSYAAAREDFDLDPEFTRQIKAFAARSHASFTGVLLTAFETLLARLSGQPDVIVGVPAAGQGLADAGRLVGHCVRMLPMRTELDLAEGFAEALRRVHASVLDSTEHHHVTFGALLKHLALRRDPAHLPLTDVLFNVERLDAGSLRFAGLEADWFSNPRRFENFDLFLNVVERPDRAVLELQYNTDLYDRETIHRWIEGLESILEQGMREPGTPLAALALLGERDRRLLSVWNDTAVEGLEGRTLTSLLARALATSPERTALRCGANSLTYAELHGRANQLARALAKRGVGRGDLVALHLPRGVDLLVGLLGILKSGAAYLPIDPELPRRRIADLLEDSGAALLVSIRALDGEAPPALLRLLLDADSDELREHPAAELEDRVGPADLAYVIYTSGSTGRPKGVEVPHACVANLLGSMAGTPGMGPGDRLLAVTNVGFDISVLELLLPLCVGGCVVLASREEAADGAALAALLERHDVGLLQATPARFRLLLDSGWQGKADLRLLCGGEALTADLARELLPRCRELWNVYGPTETTIWSTVARVPDAPEKITIGRPIANTRCYVLDEALRPVPPGVCGELYIGGAGVARGYRGQPELTAERFVPDLFAPRSAGPRARLYRTGDVARWTSGGALECLGRNDFQVKIRGHRIELGEIEHALSACDGIRQCVVAARRFGDDVRLVAWCVAPADGFDPSRLRDALRSALPEYMIPQHFVALEALPLTPNAKIDRRALPLPDPAASDASGGGEPRSALEARLHDSFCEVLGLERIGREADFFESGGHSLLAAQALARLARELDLPLPMSLLFEHPSIARLAAHLASLRAGAPAPPIARREAPGPAPLSRMQERVWFGEQMAPGSALYHIPLYWTLRGRLDLPALQRAVDAFTRRQAATRTVLRWQGAAGVQVVRDDFDFRLECVDLQPLLGAARAQELERLLRREVHRPFDLSEGPLFRIRLYRLDAEEHVLFAMAHHAIWDGWSSDLLIAELSALYAAFARGEGSPLEPLPIDYGDFAAWHLEWLESADLARQRAYWRERLSGELPVLDLEPDRRRPAHLSHAGGTIAFRIGAEEIEALRGLARTRQATLYMVLLAAFECVLHGYTRQTDLLVGTPIRARSWPETENLVGFFVNAQVLRTRLDPAEGFSAFLARVRETCLGAFANPDMPFDELVRDLGIARDPSRSPIHQAFFTFQDVRNRSSSFGDLRCEELEIAPDVTPTELSLWVKERRDSAVGGLEYATTLYTRQKAEQVVDRTLRMLRAIARAPEASVAALVEEAFDSAGGSRPAPSLGRRVLRLLSGGERRRGAAPGRAT
jgi:amino acid adenylation domain-containing protein